MTIHNAGFVTFIGSIKRRSRLSDRQGREGERESRQEENDVVDDEKAGVGRKQILTGGIEVYHVKTTIQGLMKDRLRHRFAPTRGKSMEDMVSVLFRRRKPAHSNTHTCTIGSLGSLSI